MGAPWECTDPAARLEDATQVARPREVALADAQAETNFVVFAPSWLPDGCRLAAVTLRPEQPPGRPAGVDLKAIAQPSWTQGNACSVRASIEGVGRRLRLKQFLYDWAPPAASTAALWESPTLEPFELRDAVGFVGRDYKGNAGACAQLMRTQIEVSVEAGTFADEELIRFAQGLEPAALARSEAIRAAPFHRLSYWVRYRLPGVRVPHGLWLYLRSRPYDRAQPLALPELHRTPLRILVPRGDDFTFDSAVLFDDVDPRHREVEAIFRSRRNGSDHLWIAATTAEGPGAIPLPPSPAPHRAEIREVRSLRGTQVSYASLTERYGAWEAFFEEGGVRYAVWAAASLLATGEQFRETIARLEPATAPRATGIAVRKATVDDVPGICRVCAEGWRDYVVVGLHSARYVEAVIERFYNPERILAEVRDQGFWRVAVEAGRVVGAGGGAITRPGTGELFVLYLDPKRRGEGIGTRILERIEEELRAAGAQELWLSVTKGNAKGVPFYEARGFRLLKERPAHKWGIPGEEDEGAVDLRMKKALTREGPA